MKVGTKNPRGGKHSVSVGWRWPVKVLQNTTMQRRKQLCFLGNQSWHSDVWVRASIKFSVQFFVLFLWLLPQSRIDILPSLSHPFIRFIICDAVTSYHVTLQQDGGQGLQMQEILRDSAHRAMAHALHWRGRCSVTWVIGGGRSKTTSSSWPRPQKLAGSPS